MNRLQNVTAADGKAKKLAKNGRYGDTEMAHVTPGEIVVPHSVQTPEVVSRLQTAFAEQGVPMSRYTVQGSQNSKNPDTGNPEYFGSFVKKAVGAFMGGGGGGGGGGSTNNTTIQTPPFNPAESYHPVSHGLKDVRVDAETGSPAPEDAAGAPMSQEEGGSTTSATNDTTETFKTLMKAVMGNNFSPTNKLNRVTGMPQFYDMPSRNNKTGKMEFYSVPLSDRQDAATQYALAKRLLNPGETATGGLLASRLNAVGGDAAKQYQAFMDSMFGAQNTTPTNPAVSTPASPNAGAGGTTQGTTAPGQGGTSTAAGGGNAPASGSGAAPAQAPSVYVTAAIPGTNKYLLSNGQQMDRLELGAIVQKRINKEQGLPETYGLDNNGQLNPRMTNLGYGDFGEFTSYMQKPNSLVGRSFDDPNWQPPEPAAQTPQVQENTDKPTLNTTGFTYDVNKVAAANPTPTRTSNRLNNVGTGSRVRSVDEYGDGSSESASTGSMNIGDTRPTFSSLTPERTPRFRSNRAAVARNF